MVVGVSRPISAVRRAPGWGRTGRRLRFVGLAAFAAAAAWVLAPLWSRGQPLLAALEWLVAVVFAATGVLLADEPEQRGNGGLFVGAAVFWIVGLVSTRQVGPLPLVEWVAGPLLFVFMATAMLRYPLTALQRRSERIFVHVLLGWVVLSRCVLLAISTPAELGYDAAVWWPTLVRTTFQDAAATALNVGDLVLVAVFLVLVIRRLASEHGLDRRVLTPVAVAASAAAALVLADVVTRFVPHSDDFRYQLLSVEAVALLAIPGSFFVAAIRRRLERAAVADLVIRVSRPGTLEHVRDALRQALYDPSLDVLYWVPDEGGYIDMAGRDTDLGAAARDRFVVPVTASDGQPLAAVLVDPSLVRHRGVLDAAVSACGLALENARLQASVRAQLEQVRASRARIVEAGLEERRRLERDLHDGTQQRLLALTTYLATRQLQSDDPATVQVLEQARVELSEVLHELRDFAHGIHPAVLTQEGLGPALESVAERLPLPVRINVAPKRWSAAVESTAYFLACEALANAVKHAGASGARVDVRQLGGDVLVEISDDGSGGAAFTSGGGLAGLRDRVAALGGDLSIVTGPAEGTTVAARIPCG